mmetsp:Transcript_9210/g.11361  ORF Transcript_9210/g.11361 Transcript_9210/m.11361 type:complete len:89 (+) Transcript_9210:132-398(+)
MASTLDTQARDLPSDMTTIEAGLGYVDDCINSRVKRYRLAMLIADTASNILPWIVNRTKIESLWPFDHQNGRSKGSLKPRFKFDQLYF